MAFMRESPCASAARHVWMLARANCRREPLVEQYCATRDRQLEARPGRRHPRLKIHVGGVGDFEDIAVRVAEVDSVVAFRVIGHFDGAAQDLSVELARGLWRRFRLADWRRKRA